MLLSAVDLALIYVIGSQTSGCVLHFYSVTLSDKQLQLSGTDSGLFLVEVKLLSTVTLLLFGETISV